jgi:hypothetical protein
LADQALPENFAVLRESPSVNAVANQWATHLFCWDWSHTRHDKAILLAVGIEGACARWPPPESKDSPEIRQELLKVLGCMPHAAVFAQRWGLPEPSKDVSRQLLLMRPEDWL